MEGCGRCPLTSLYEIIRYARIDPMYICDHARVWCTPTSCVRTIPLVAADPFSERDIFNPEEERVELVGLIAELVVVIIAVSLFVFVAVALFYGPVSNAT